MTAQPQFVLSQAVPHPELPPWVARFAVLMRVLLHRAETARALEQVRLVRKPGYSFIDELGFLVAFTCWNPHGSIKEFSRISHQNGLGSILAGILGRDKWPGDSSISRCLKSTRQENIDQFRTHVLPLAQAGSEFMTSPWVLFRDSHGESWLVFDLDGTVRAFRQRGLPNGTGLPDPVRWTEQIAQPGYPGRKRGESQVSSYRLHQAGSNQWLGQGAVAGNPVMSEVVQEVSKWIVALCGSLGIPSRRVILRIDGAGGNSVCLKACQEAGFHTLVRWPYYHLLDSPQVREHLGQEVWSEVPDSESGPTRYAAELGTSPWSLGDQPPPTGTRVVVSRFLSAQEGKKRGAGHLIGPAHYELFATDLTASDWPAEDLVWLYFGRAAHENSLGQGNREKGLTRMLCKTNRQGQNLAQLVLMLVWNLETTLGWQLKASSERPPPVPRQTIPRRRFADIPPVDPPTPPVESPRAEELSLVAPAALEALKLNLEKREGWSLDPNRGVVCPQGYGLKLHHQSPASVGNTAVVFRAPKRACPACPRRQECSSSKAANFRKELWVTLPGKDFPSSWPRIEGTPYVSTPPPPSVAYPTWVAPAPVTSGPWNSDGPGLVAGQLRTTFQRACETAIVRVDLSCSTPPTPIASHLAPTAAKRQQRRQTYDERVARNALPPSSKAVVAFLHAQPLANVLNLLGCA
jgi:hypothetical protein